MSLHHCSRHSIRSSSNVHTTYEEAVAVHNISNTLCPGWSSAANVFSGNLKWANQFVGEEQQMRAELVNLHLKAARLHKNMKNSHLGLPRGWDLKVRSYCVVNKKVLQESIQIKLELDARVLKLGGGDTAGSVSDEVRYLLEKLMLGINPTVEIGYFESSAPQPWLRKNKHLTGWDFKRQLMPADAKGGNTPHNTILLCPLLPCDQPLPSDARAAC